ncbi:MAG: DUF4129 domain-containing protein [Woeseiaceae bacterium]|nr:DUF4129 domain-containing protein [Woeseiaceae bacterium]
MSETAARLVTLSLLTLFSASALADVSTQIAACAEGKDDEWQFDAVADACPEVLAIVDAHPLADTMPANWSEALTPFKTTQLDFFDAYYVDSGPDTGIIGTASLDAIVDELDNPSRVEEEKSAWQRFTDWLKEIFGDDEGETPQWLDEWLSKIKIPQTALQYTFYVLAVLIIIGAIAVIVIEIRAARSSYARERAAQAGMGGYGAAGPVMLTLADLDAAELRDKPTIMLRLIVQRLEALAMLTHQPAATHRELALTPAGLAEEQRASLVVVSRSAERARYGGGVPKADEVDEALRQGSSLLERLKRR